MVKDGSCLFRAVADQVCFRPCEQLTHGIRSTRKKLIRMCPARSYFCRSPSTRMSVRDVLHIFASAVKTLSRSSTKQSLGIDISKT